MNLAHYLSQSTGGVGVFGAVVGGAAAAARNIKDYQLGIVTPKEAAYDTGKEAAGAGAATAVGAVAAGAVGGSLALSLGTAFLVAAGAKFAWDRAVEECEKKYCKKDDDDLDQAMAEVMTEEVSA